MHGGFLARRGTSRQALVDRGLIARYLVNEASSGSGPTKLLDRSGFSHAADLDITYDTALAFVQVNGSKALYFPHPDDNNRAVYYISSGDKFKTNLEGSTTVTLEWVSIDIAYTNNGSRVFALNATNGNYPDFGIYSRQATSSDSYIYINWYPAEVEGRLIGSFDNSSIRDQLNVWQLVFDTRLSNATDRVALYKNGSVFSFAHSADPTQNYTLHFSSANPAALFVGNRQSGGTWARSFQGNFFYGAVYNTALTESECAQNARVLLKNNDTQ